MCRYVGQGWQCEFCGARNETESNLCWQCRGDKKKAAQIKQEKNLAPSPCDTHNVALSWDCRLCGARNYGDTGAAPCRQCQGDSQRAKAIKRGLAK
jgi:ribosomal protein L40E